MRIEGNHRPTGATKGAGRSTLGGSSFSVDSGTTVRETQSSAPASVSPAIDSLLALQSVEDPLLSKKKALRRGNALLDTLEGIQADLLVGRVGEGRLNRLMALVTQMRERCDPKLEALLDDIELRARVELAKHGHYTAA